ncbi:MAG: hypothetical protein MJE77_34495 [Proteobacteria bacterium]|nr:hypothetical protein [Pseudomonadota bacterium]
MPLLDELYFTAFIERMEAAGQLDSAGVHQPMVGKLVRLELPEPTSIDSIE